MKDTIETSQPSMASAVINYMLNRFMPFICAGGLLFYACGYDSLIPYAVLGFMWFVSKFSFDCGVAFAMLEQELNSCKAMIFAEDEKEEEKIAEKVKKERK